MLVLGAWYSVESKVDHAYRVIVPCIKGTHWPEIATRSPQSSHQSSPVRAEICRAKSVFLPSFFAQYGIRVVWAEPVTGSSLMLCLGTKKAVSERFVFGCDLLHCCNRNPTIQRADGRRVAAKETVSESVDMVNVDLHGVSVGLLQVERKRRLQPLPPWVATRAKAGAFAYKG